MQPFLGHCISMPQKTVALQDSLNLEPGIIYCQQPTKCRKNILFKYIIYYYFDKKNSSET